MPSLGNLFVRLGLDDSDLNRGATQSRRTLGGLRSEMRSLANTAGKVSVSAGAVGGALLVGLVNRGGEAAQEIKNLSQVANASTREFQRNAAAARTVGVENEKLADIYKDMNDRVGDFLETGAGPMADFFENIAPQVGVTAEQFAKLSGPDALQLFVDSLEQANVGQAQMTFYMEQIASDSTRLLPLLRDNGRAMETAGDRAEELGRVLSDVQLDALDDAKVSIDELGFAMGRTATLASATFAPPVQAIAEVLQGELADAFKESEDDVVSWGETFSRVLVFVADAAGAATGTIGTVFATLGRDIGARAAQLNAGLRGNFSEVRSIQSELTQDLSDMWGDLLNDSNFTKYRDRWAELRDEIDSTRDSATGFGQELTGQLNMLAGGGGGDGAAVSSGQDIERMGMGGISRMRQTPTLADPMEAARERGEERLKQVERQLMSERELQQENYEQQLEMLIEAKDAEAVTEQEYRELREEAESQHVERMNKLREQEKTQAERFAEMGTRNKLTTVLGGMKEMTAGVASENKKMFEVNKALALAEAAITLPSAVLKSFNNAGGYPWGIAPAAAMAATGLAKIQAIESAQFGGGAAASVAGSTAAEPVSDVGSGGGRDRTLFVEGIEEGQMHSGGQVRGLVQEIQDFVDDGGKVKLS